MIRPCPLLPALLLTLLLTAPCLAAAPASTPMDESALRSRLAEQDRLVAEQQKKIEQLEAKVGLPSTPSSWAWFLVGLVGEGVFFMRFVVQWWASERSKRTVVPLLFWNLSLLGTALVLAYAVYLVSWVFILAYSLNIFLYVRNLIIAKRHPEAEALAEKTSE